MNISGGGVPKLPVQKAWIRVTGIEGDRQRHLKFHGGPTRAVSLFSLEIIETLRAEGHPITPGSTGENVTISGLQWNTMAPGTRLLIGSAKIELTGYAVPCKQIRDSFAGAQIERISQKLNPGWSRVYARVILEGEVAVGDAVQVVGE